MLLWARDTFEVGGGFADCIGGTCVVGAELGCFVELGDGGEAGLDRCQLGAFVVDLLEAGLEVLELGRVDELEELGERKAVVIAQVECGDRGVEEIADECVGERGRDWGLATWH